MKWLGMYEYLGDVGGLQFTYVLHEDLNYEKKGLTHCFN